MAIEWKDSLSVGIPEIDLQHRSLIELLSNLEFMISKDSRYEWQTYGRLVMEIDRYASMHFAMEEELMQKHGYPGFTEHKARHDSFRRRMEEIKQEGAKNARIPIKEIGEFLNQWILDHIFQVDQEMGRFFKAKNIGAGS